MKFPVFKKKEDICLGLDVGTEAVKAIIFARTKERVNVLSCSLEYLDKFGVFDSRDLERDIYKRAISKTINEVMTVADKKKRSEFSSVFLVLPPNILKGRIIFQRVIRDKYKEIIDKREEKSIYQLVFQKVQQKSSQIFEKETGILPEEVKFIDQDFLEIKIDGYPVPNLSGFNGRFLDFKILVTFLPKRYFQNVQGLMRSLGLEVFKLVHESELLRLFLNSKSGSEISDAILLDIGGEVTQVFLVKNEKIDFIGELDIGGENFSQALAKNFGMMFDRARILKHRYSKKLLSEAVRKGIREKFLEVSEDWLLNLRSRLLKLSKETLIPSDIFIFGGASLLAEIKEVLQGDYLVNLPLTGEVRVEFLYPKNLGIINKDSKRLPNKLKPFLEFPQYTPTSLICYAQ